MKLSFVYGNEKVNYDLSFKKRGNIAIELGNNGEVRVVAPVGTSVYTVMDKVKGNAPWILQQLHALHNQDAPVDSTEGAVDEVEEKEQYMYLGRNYGYELVINPDKQEPSVKLLRGKFVVEASSDAKIPIVEAIRTWFIDKAEAKLKERLKEYKPLFEKEPTDIRIEGLENELTIVTEDNEIILDYKFVMAPVHVIDYIIVSCMCAVNDKMDSAEFESKMISILPEYTASREWLEENKGRFNL